MSARRQPVAIGSLLDGCLDSATGQPGAAAIWRVWEDAVGIQIARRAQPMRLRGRTLVITVSSTPWMQELHLLAPMVCREINARLGSAMVGELFLVLSEGDKQEASVSKHATPSRCPQPPRKPDLANLSPTLRQSFADLLVAWHRRSAMQEES